MVFELLGFNFNWTVWKTFPSVVDQIDQMADLFERAIAKWGDLPKVVSAFAYFATIVPSSRLLVNHTGIIGKPSASHRHGPQSDTAELRHHQWASGRTRSSSLG